LLLQHLVGAACKRIGIKEANAAAELDFVTAPKLVLGDADAVDVRSVLRLEVAQHEVSTHAVEAGVPTTDAPIAQHHLAFGIAANPSPITLDLVHGADTATVEHRQGRTRGPTDRTECRFGFGCARSVLFVLEHTRQPAMLAYAAEGRGIVGH